LKYLLFIFTLTIVLKSSAQSSIVIKDTINNSLSEVVVSGIISDKKISTSTENIQVISSADLQVAEGVNYSSILNKVPGVFMQSGALNTNRITIRGIGARSPFGTTSIRAYFGEIPLTDGNGNSAIEDFELGAISRIEIHKGPSGSSFGVGLGGTIILRPKYEVFQKATSSIASTHGSYGLQRELIKVGVANTKIATNLVYSNTLSDGYRENNKYNRQTFTASVLATISKKDTLQFIGNYTDLKAFIPSSVNLETFNTNPKSAAPTWRDAQGFEDTQSILAGLTWNHSFSNDLQVLSSVYTSAKKNNEPRPFNILKEKSNTYGIRSRVAGNVSNKIKWGIGGELFYDNLKNSTFENRYKDFPLGTGSILGEQLSKLDEVRSYYNLFGETSYRFNKKLLVNLGVNFNQTSYKIKDQLNQGEEDQSGDLSFNPILSPKLGLLFNLKKNIILKASIAHGFAPPTTEETLLPEGEINTNLKPEQGWNFEVGSQFSFLKNRLYGDVSIYNLKVTDLLVSRRSENDALFAINAGKTNHIGLEGNLNYEVLTTEKLSLLTFMNYSIYQYKFNTFIDEGNDFSNNKLTGVPSGVFNTGISFESNLGLFGNINFQYVGRIPANDANTVFSDSYKLVNAKMGYQTMFKKLNFKAFAGINNILDEKYVSQLQVNASSFGGRAPRYYYAGNPVNFYGGIVLSYLFF